MGYGPEPGGCVDILRELGARSVKGNHDIAVNNVESSTSNFNVHAAMAIEVNRRLLNQGQLRWISTLQRVYNIDLEGYKISVFHGSPHKMYCPREGTSYF